MHIAIKRAVALIGQTNTRSKTPSGLGSRVGRRGVALSFMPAPAPHAKDAEIPHRLYRQLIGAVLRRIGLQIGKPAGWNRRAAPSSGGVSVSRRYLLVHPRVDVLFEPHSAGVRVVSEAEPLWESAERPTEEHAEGIY